MVIRGSRTGIRGFAETSTAATWVNEPLAVISITGIILIYIRVGKLENRIVMAFKVSRKCGDLQLTLRGTRLLTAGGTSLEAMHM